MFVAFSFWTLKRNRPELWIYLFYLDLDIGFRIIFSLFSQGTVSSILKRRGLWGLLKKDVSEAVFDEIKAEVRITKDCNYE